MGLFRKNSEGGLVDVIRCDEQEYLVWKWRPSGDANSTKKENAIRYGSSLRVKDGELAVFVYNQGDGSIYDFLVGPFDHIIKTGNFPVLSSIVGSAFGGSTPFQAEIYFVNLSGNIQVRFGIPYFDVFDPRFLDFAVPMTARGTITFNLTDYKSFIKLNRLVDFELDDFSSQIRDSVAKYVKGVIMNIPSERGIPVLQMERNLLEINELVAAYLKPRLEDDFGVNMKGFDLATIEADKESKGYAELRKVTADQTTKTTIAQTDVMIKNLEDVQEINTQNMNETLRIQREEAQRAQKLQTESNYMGAHALNQQTDVLVNAAQNLGNMSSMNLGDGGGMNPAGIMSGMLIGGAMGNQMAGMMNQMGQNIVQQQNTPPPLPQIQYNVSLDGQAAGPFNWEQLLELVQNGRLTKNSYVWKQGMNDWVLAVDIQELERLFIIVSPPPPPPVF
jgi:membrane protease subunit (stomatin/prohibitin family)